VAGWRRKMSRLQLQMATPDLSTSPFRQSAIDRLSSPEQLDRMVKVADAKGWIAVLGIAILVGFAIFYGVSGSIATEVQAPGILVLRGGHLMAIPSPANGVITEIRVHTGDVVTEGEVVAIVQQTDLQQKLTGAEGHLRARENTLAMRRVALAREMDARKQDADLRRAAMGQALAATAQRIDRLQRTLAIREQLLSQHLTVEDRVDQARSDLAQARQELQDWRAKLLELDGSLLDTTLAQQKEVDGLEQAVDEAKREVADIQSRLQESREVLSPVAGRVTEVTSTLGATVDPGTPILNIETPGQGLEATIYIPLASGKRVHPGMQVRIEPSTVRRDEFGTLIGSVEQVSSFPATPAGMRAVLQNQQLVDSFAAGAPPYEARAVLQPAQTPTGYAWTSGSGPHVDLTSGTPVKAYVVVDRNRPIVVLLPFLRPLFGDN
jgi:HlyD family secretion protein